MDPSLFIQQGPDDLWAGWGGFSWLHGGLPRLGQLAGQVIDDQPKQTGEDDYLPQVEDNLSLADSGGHKSPSRLQPLHELRKNGLPGHTLPICRD